VAKIPLLDPLNHYFDKNKFINISRMLLQKSGFWTFDNLSVNNKKGVWEGSGRNKA
jgi:hypothetical protein